MENLPRYFVLESLSNKKYLRSIHEEDVVLHGHLEFSGEEAISLHTKYEFEPAKEEANKGLFHIRSCYSNKYWARRGKTTWWITAMAAARPEEDQFKWSCTLFQPSIQVSSDGKSMLKLIHVQNGRYAPVSVGSRDPTYRSCLKADGRNLPLPSEDTSSFSIIDWESFVILPKRVAFKGHNGLYARYHGYLPFDASDIAILGVVFETVYTPEGSVQIKSSLHPRMWYLEKSSSLIGLTHVIMPEFAFWPVRGHGDNEVALRSKENNKFCQRSLADSNPIKSYALRVEAFFMIKEAIMRVEEPVVSRSIYNVDFRLKDARIYDQSLVLMMSKQFNNPLNVDEVTQLTHTFTKETPRTWKCSVSLKLPTSTTIKTGVPLIVDGNIGIWDEFEGRYEWGTDMKAAHTTDISHHITIPADSDVVVHVIATKAKCEVPFSYIKRDTLIDGKVVINKMEDGVYTVINFYNFKTQITEMP